MKDITKLIQAATEKGYYFEAHSNVCGKYYKISDWDNKATYKTYFGFTTDHNVYYWFSQYNYQCADIKGMAMFDERYSRITGKSIKTWKQERKALKLLGL